MKKGGMPCVCIVGTLILVVLVIKLLRKLRHKRHGKHVRRVQRCPRCHSVAFVGNGTCIPCQQAGYRY